MLVLVLKPPALLVDETLSFDRLPHHRCDQTKAIQFDLIIPVRNKRQIDAERAGSPSLHEDGHGYVSYFATAEVPVSRAIQEHRFAAGLRHDDRPSGFHN